MNSCLVEPSCAPAGRHSPLLPLPSSSSSELTSDAPVRLLMLLCRYCLVGFKLPLSPLCHSFYSPSSHPLQLGASFTLLLRQHGCTGGTNAWPEA